MAADDAVIAVSSSGFTDGAIKKAKQFHIPLRTLQQLTDEEIRIWARATSVRVIFYEFSDTIISFAFPPLPDGGLPYPITITKDDSSPVNWRGALEFVMNNLDDKGELDSCSAHFNVEIFAPLLVSGMRPTKIELSASVRRLSRELPLDMVLNYASIDDAGSTVAQVSHGG